jgi:hypothetical protein
LHGIGDVPIEPGQALWESHLSIVTLLVKRVGAALRTAVKADTGGGHWWRTTVQDRMEDVMDV